MIWLCYNIKRMETSTYKDTNLNLTAITIKELETKTHIEMHNSLQIGMHMYRQEQSHTQTPHHICITNTYPHTLMWVCMFTWMCMHTHIHDMAYYCYTPSIRCMLCGCTYPHTLMCVWMCIHVYAYTYPIYGILLLHSIYASIESMLCGCTYPHTLMRVWMFTWMACIHVMWMYISTYLNVGLDVYMDGVYTCVCIHVYAYTYPRYGILLLHSIYQTYVYVYVYVYVIYIYMAYIFHMSLSIQTHAHVHMHGWVRGITSYAKQNNPICDNKTETTHHFELRITISNQSIFDMQRKERNLEEKSNEFYEK